MTSIFGFLYMQCILAPPGEFDWTIRVRRQYGLIVTLFLPIVNFGIKNCKYYITSCQSNVTTCHIAATHGQFNGIYYLPGGASVTWAYLSPILYMASRSVQPFLHSLRQRIAILYNGPPLQPIKIFPSHGDLDATWFLWPIRAHNANGISLGSAEPV